MEKKENLNAYDFSAANISCKINPAVAEALGVQPGEPVWPCPWTVCNDEELGNGIGFLKENDPFAGMFYIPVSLLVMNEKTKTEVALHRRTLLD